jgi:hypothetical protein
MAPGEKKKEELENRELVEGVDYQIEPAEPGWNWYISKQAGFKIKYPTDCRNFEAYLFWLRMDIGGGRFDISRCPPEELEEMKVDSLWQFMKWWIESWHFNDADFKVLEFTNLTLDKAPAARVIYTYYSTTQGEKFGWKQKGVSVGAFKDGYAYVIEYEHAEVENFDKDYPTIQKMINSFQFI